MGDTKPGLQRSSTVRRWGAVVSGFGVCSIVVVLALGRAPAPFMISLVLVMKASIDAQAAGTSAAARRRAASALGATLGAGVLGASLLGQIPTRPVPPSLGGMEWILDALSGSVLFVSVMFAFLLGSLITNLILRRTSWRGRTGLLRYAGVLATALLAGLSTLGVVRSVTRPSVERYLEDLMSASKAPAPPPGCVRVVAAMTPPVDVRREVDDLVVLARCGTYASCGIGVFARETTPVGGEGRDFPFMVASCSAFEATRLSPDLVLVRAVWQESRFQNGTVVEDALFRRRGDHWSMSAHEDLVAGKASPPRAWVACGLAGLALSIAAWIRRAHALRRWRAKACAENAAPPAPESDPGVDAEAIACWEAWALAISSLAAAPLVAAGVAGLLL